MNSAGKKISLEIFLGKFFHASRYSFWYLIFKSVNIIITDLWGGGKKLLLELCDGSLRLFDEEKSEVSNLNHSQLKPYFSFYNETWKVK